MKKCTTTLGVLLFIAAINTTASPMQGVPALSIVAPNGQTSILIGSLHVAIVGLPNPDKSIFKNAKRFVKEHYSNSTHGDNGDDHNPSLASWAQDLTDEEVAIYLKRAHCSGMKNEDALKKLYRPSAQHANQLAYTICDSYTVFSRDDWFDLIKPVELKTDVLEEDAWVENKRLIVAKLENNAGLKWILAHDPKTVLSGISYALNNGDYDSVLEQTNVSFGDQELASKTYGIMVVDRNIAWMPRLKQYLDEGSAVILVGAAHLPGTNGLINLLKSNGYTVQSIRLPETGK